MAEQVNRKQDGQPNRANALRHGFYSRAFSEQENADLDMGLLSGLADEIALMRVAIRRVFELSSAVEQDGDLNPAIQAMAALGTAAVRLGSLLELQETLGGEGEAQGTIRKAMREMAKELREGKGLK